jgi:capsular polysaccharide biosynthesis protein
MRSVPRKSVLRWTLSIVAVGAAFAAAAFLAASLQEDQYTARTTLLFRGRTFAEAIPSLPVRGPSEETTPSPAAMEAVLSLPVIADRTAQSLPGVLSGEEISNRVELQMHPGSHLVTVNATDPGANGAAAIANVYADQAIRLYRAVNRRLVGKAIDGQEHARLEGVADPGRKAQAERILRRLGGRLQTLLALQVGALEQVEPAAAPADPSSPDPGTDVLLALLVGICGGAALAALLDGRERVHDVKLLDPQVGA